MGIDVSVITQHGKRYNCSVPCENGAITGKALRERIVDQLASSGMSSSNLNITCAGVEIKSGSAVNENMRCEARVAGGAVQDRARPRSESPAFRKPRRTYGSGTNPATIHSRSENQFCEARAPRRSLAVSTPEAAPADTRAPQGKSSSCSCSSTCTCRGCCRSCRSASLPGLCRRTYRRCGAY